MQCNFHTLPCNSHTYVMPHTKELEHQMHNLCICGIWDNTVTVCSVQNNAPIQYQLNASMPQTMAGVYYVLLDSLE